MKLFRGSKREVKSSEAKDTKQMAWETANGIPKWQEEVNETSASAQQGARKAQASVIAELLANV
jgi:hypothetical protein